MKNKANRLLIRMSSSHTLGASRINTNATRNHHSLSILRLLKPVTERFSLTASPFWRKQQVEPGQYAGTKREFSNISLDKHDRNIREEHGDLLDRLKRLDTALLCDADKSLFGPLPLANNDEGSPSSRLRLMSQDIKSLTKNQPEKGSSTMVGWARTVQCTTPNDFLPVLRGLTESQRGEVLVVDTMGSTRAVAGGLFATEASHHKRQLAGIIIDGPMRDVASLSHNLPCYATCVTPYSGTTQSPGQMQTRIKCGGVIVNPGDIIVGDEDGIVAASVETLQSIIDQAEAIQLVEQDLMNGIVKEGKSLASMSNFHKHVEKRISKREDSNLKFFE